MYKLIVLFSTAAAVLGAPKGDPRNISVSQLDGRIVGGHDADINDYPYQITMEYYRIHRCGGTIISSKFVVTAAHCTNGVHASNMTIRAGSSIKENGGVVIPVAQIHQHPQYVSSSTDYDISVLELSNELTFGPGIAAADLPSLNENVAVGTNCVASGWGALNEGGSSPQQLQVVEVPIVDFEECRNVYGSLLTERMICAGFKEGGKDACQGDSGGPLVVGKKLIGVVSWGHGCAVPNYPGVYSSVPNLRQFITEASGL